MYILHVGTCNIRTHRVGRTMTVSQLQCRPFSMNGATQRMKFGSRHGGPRHGCSAGPHDKLALHRRPPAAAWSPVTRKQELLRASRSGRPLQVAPHPRLHTAVMLHDQSSSTSYTACPPSSMLVCRWHLALGLAMLSQHRPQQHARPLTGRPQPNVRRSQPAALRCNQPLHLRLAAPRRALQRRPARFQLRRSWRCSRRRQLLLIQPLGLSHMTILLAQRA